VRLFFAVELPAQTRASLSRLRPQDDLGYRWVDPAQLHLTLAFLGEQPEDSIASLAQIAASAAAASGPLRLKLGQPGSFGPRRSPRVLWVGLEGEVARLLALQSALHAGLHAAGVVREEREFRPHITLARRRESAQPSTSPVWPPAQLPISTFEADHLTLFQSRLSPHGATYVAMAHIPLG
jgi:2'-5' RNA ligase